MRISRAPERRGGSNKILLYLSLVVTVVIVGILIAYFTAGFESRSATGDQTGLNELAVSPVEVSPAEAPVPTTTPEPETDLKLLATEPIALDRVIPEAKFGEVLSEGLTEVNLPGDVTAESWYTFQVNTATQDITLFFALYGNSGDTITRTVKIEGYTQRGNLNKAEVTIFYPEGPERLITYDDQQGTVTLSQQYPQPYGPSMFSPQLRVGMVNQKMILTDETGEISAQLQLDLSGLSDSEHLVFERSAPEQVAAALSEIQDIVMQIEDKHTRS